MFSDTSFYTILYESIYIFGFILVTMFFKIIFIIIIFVLCYQGPKPKSWLWWVFKAPTKSELASCPKEIKQK